MSTFNPKHLFSENHFTDNISIKQFITQNNNSNEQNIDIDLFLEKKKN